MAEADPDYCCALISDARGWLLLQLRPATARHAPGLLTCFGGRREPGEDPLACLRRELDEELGWVPAQALPTCALWGSGRLIARFYGVAFDRRDRALRTEPGHHALWAPWAALPGLPLSPWHRAVLDAVAAGRERVEVMDG